MPVVRYTGGATYALRGGPTWTPGNEHEVGDATADRLTGTAKFELVEDASDGESGDGYPVRVESYTRQGNCGHFDPETMDDPCARAAGWGRDADSGPCIDHTEGN